MAFFAGLTSRRAYMAHLKGNQLMEEGKIQEAEAKHQEAIALYEESFKKGVKTDLFGLWRAANAPPGI